MTETTSLPRDTPVRLAVAAKLAFPHGGMTASGLRREANKGRLTVMRIAGKDFTTLSAIEEMLKKCRLPANPQGSGFVQLAKTGTQPGSSSTEGSSIAHDAAWALVNKLKKR